MATQICAIISNASNIAARQIGLSWDGDSDKYGPFLSRASSFKSTSVGAPKT
jgi:hypothetical protein